MIARAQNNPDCSWNLNESRLGDFFDHPIELDVNETIPKFFTFSTKCDSLISKIRDEVLAATLEGKPNLIQDLDTAADKLDSLQEFVLAKMRIELGRELKPIKKLYEQLDFATLLNDEEVAPHCVRDAKLILGLAEEQGTMFSVPALDTDGSGNVVLTWDLATHRYQLTVSKSEYAWPMVRVYEYISRHDSSTPPRVKVWYNVKSLVESFRDLFNDG